MKNATARSGLLSVALLLSHAVCGQDRDALIAVLEEARVEFKAPGLRAAVRDADGNIMRAAVGLGDIENDIPLDDDIGMPGGSTGKTFVAALTMLLVEDGTLSLDDSAEQWLGNEGWFDRLPNAAAIRVRHLLAHTSGIPDYPRTGKFNRAMIWRVIRHGSAKFQPEELIGYTLGRRPPFAPGEGFQYSDTGYLVLGRLIEAATGRGYYELLQERILDPQQLDAIRPADRSVLTGITPGYMGGARNLNRDGRMKFDPSSEWTGGGLITTPTMLVRFFGALAEGRVVSEDSFRQMLEGGWRDPDRPDEHYGYGVFVWPEDDTFGHSGLWPGYRTVVAHNLASGITIAVQTNRDGRIDLQGLVVRIAALLNHRMGQSSFSKTPRVR